MTALKRVNFHSYAMGHESLSSHTTLALPCVLSHVHDTRTMVLLIIYMCYLTGDNTTSLLVIFVLINLYL